MGKAEVLLLGLLFILHKLQLSSTLALDVASMSKSNQDVAEHDKLGHEPSLVDTNKAKEKHESRNIFTETIESTIESIKCKFVDCPEEHSDGETSTKPTTTNPTTTSPTTPKPSTNNATKS